MAQNTNRNSQTHHHRSLLHLPTQPTQLLQQYKDLNQRSTTSRYKHLRHTHHQTRLRNQQHHVRIMYLLIYCLEIILEGYNFVDFAKKTKQSTCTSHINRLSLIWLQRCTYRNAVRYAVTSNGTQLLTVDHFPTKSISAGSTRLELDPIFPHFPHSLLVLRLPLRLTSPREHLRKHHHTWRLIPQNMPITIQNQQIMIPKPFLFFSDNKKHQT